MKNYIAERERRRICKIVWWARRTLPRDQARHWPTVEAAWGCRFVDELTDALKRFYPHEAIREMFRPSPWETMLGGDDGASVARTTTPPQSTRRRHVSGCAASFATPPLPSNQAEDHV